MCDGERHVHIVGLRAAKHGGNEGGVEERHVRGGDICRLGVLPNRREARGQPLKRPAALARVGGEGDRARQFRKHLSRRLHHHDRAIDNTRNDAHDPPQEGGPVPLERGLRPAHPGGPPAGQNDARGGWRHPAKPT